MSAPLLEIADLRVSFRNAEGQEAWNIRHHEQ